MKILPSSVENVGGFIFKFKLENVPVEFSLHRLMLDVKDNALKAELGDVFEKYPSEHNKDSLRVDFVALDGLSGPLTVNSKWVKLLKFGDFYKSGEENLTIIRKLVELSKSIAKVPFDFKNNLSEMKDSIKTYNFEPTGVKIAHEPDVLGRFADEVTVGRVYDSKNAKYVSGQLGEMVHRDVLHYFDVL